MGCKCANVHISQSVVNVPWDIWGGGGHVLQKLIRKAACILLGIKRICSEYKVDTKNKT